MASRWRLASNLDFLSLSNRNLAFSFRSFCSFSNFSLALLNSKSIFSVEFRDL
ncbi:hypothetical protein Hanom_Chr04g00381291 [Helianthus anomalus]